MTMPLKAISNITWLYAFTWFAATTMARLMLDNMQFIVFGVALIALQYATILFIKDVTTWRASHEKGN